MKEVIEGWWDALNFELQIYYGIAIVAMFSLFIQLLLSFFMGMDDGHADLGAGDHASGLSIFSVRGVTAFFLGFGWTGVICTKAGLGTLPTVAISVGVGGALMLTIFFMMLSLLRMQSSGTLNYNNAIGQTGTVYVTVPPGGRAGGQIEILIQGRLATAEAMQHGAEPITPGTKVRVVERIGSSTLVIEPLS